MGIYARSQPRILATVASESLSTLTQAQSLLRIPPELTYKHFIFLPQRENFVFYMHLSTNGDYFPKEY